MTDAPNYLTTAELAQRWRVSVKTVRGWRFRKVGPPFFKPNGDRGKALYRLSDIIEWERRNGRTVA